LTDFEARAERRVGEKSDRISTYGFCYHCMDCEFSNGFAEPAIIHSQLRSHAVKRTFRESCEKHGRVEN